MKNKLVAAGVVALLLVPTPGTVAAPKKIPGAGGADCIGVIKVNASIWGHNSYYGEPVIKGRPPRPVTEPRKIRDRVTHAYDYCRVVMPRTGGAFTGIMPISTTFCATQVQTDKDYDKYDGSEYEAYYYDDAGATVNMPPIYVDNVNGDHQCRTQTIPASERTWLNYDTQNPRYNVWSQVRRKSPLPDEGRQNWNWRPRMGAPVRTTAPYSPPQEGGRDIYLRRRR